jgi:hypothetical protein
MSIESNLSDSLEYTREALVGKWGRWILLIISSIIFPLMYGYSLRIMRGEKPAPELDNWVRLFIDGILLFIIMIVYILPVVLLALLGFGLYFIPVSVQSGPAGAADPGMGMMGVIIALLVTIAIAVGMVALALIAQFGFIRFARTGRFGEAFNIGAIVKRIGSIGWLSYFVAVVIVSVVISIVQFLLLLIPVLGILLVFILTPAFTIFYMRFITRVYDSVPSTA